MATKGQLSQLHHTPEQQVPKRGSQQGVKKSLPPERSSHQRGKQRGKKQSCCRAKQSDLIGNDEQVKINEGRGNQ